MLVGEKLDIIIEGYSSYCVASSRPPLGETPDPESAASGVEFSNCHIDVHQYLIFGDGTYRLFLVEST